MKVSGKKLLILLLISVLPLALVFGFFQEGASGDQESSLQELRIQAIRQLIALGFDRFVTVPFGPGNDALHIDTGTIAPNYPDYTVKGKISVQDDLDALLASKSFGALILSVEDISHLKKVYLFKNEQDIKALGYVVSSYRTRINNDAARRKDNISLSYRNIGNVRVLNTHEEFSFMNEVHYDPVFKDWKRPFVNGRAIMGGLTKVVGGGICGAARGINTVILPNKAFEVITRYNHTRTYKNMYDNEINGKEFWIPGLDVAVYRMAGSTKDFVFKNARDYPVVLVMNYDGTLGGTEELFVLSKENDRGELKYLGKNGSCYSWEANGLPFRSCYKAVAR